MNKHILLFGAGKSASCLIEFLLRECESHGWQLTVADSNLALAQSKLGLSPLARAISLQVENDDKRARIIRDSDIVISLLPPYLHILVASDCLQLGKDLLTASYVDESIEKLGPEITRKGVLFLCEMGLDPGIDHMSALEMVDNIKEKGGEITSFKSHCGGLVAPESDDNPWHYKISWNPRNIVNAGKTGAVFIENGIVMRRKYEELFDCRDVSIGRLGLAYYPNRDSLNYASIYGLEKAETFIRTTLRYPEFCNAWKAIISAGLTDDLKTVNYPGLTFKDWSETILPFVRRNNREQLFFLGLFDNKDIPSGLKSSADILQYLLETKLFMQSHDKDMIVMLHEIEYKLGGRKMKMESSLVVIGEDSTYTAMAKTVGLPLGIAASNILQKKILLTGLHIPTKREIYEPVLKQLGKEGIVFDFELREL